MQDCRAPTRGGRPGWRRCATESRRSTGSCPTATASSGRGKGPVAPVPPPDPQGPQPHRPGPPGRTIRAPAAPPRRPRRLKRAHRVSPAQVELRHSDLGLVVRLPVARHRRQKKLRRGAVAVASRPPTNGKASVRPVGPRTLRQDQEEAFGPADGTISQTSRQEGRSGETACPGVGPGPLARYNSPERSVRTGVP